ncbi:hypothetical protein FB451DRAFT_1170917 [Mycena latifolia]|nr:hypothetical protein FB451DRAFT_1170917 [Mycena latifolia]
MGRWTQYDEDSYRLPAGMVRTGYDADTGQYIFQDRSGTYRGLPGAQYGPMFPASATQSPVPRKVIVESEPNTRSETAKRRATLPNVPSALRSLRRSLTAVRRPWRRDHSPASDDEEPVMVSRPASAAARPLERTLSAAAAPRRNSVSTAASLPPTRTTSKTEARSSKSAAPSPAPRSMVSKPSKHTGDASKSLPPLPPAASHKPTAADPTPIASRFARKSADVASPNPVVLSRSATTSAARSPQSKDRSRRSASDHVFAARSPTSARTIATAGATSSSSSSVASPAVPGAAAKAQNVPSNRPASERTSASSASAHSTSTASPRPRTSSPMHLTRSLSATAEAPRTSRTMAIAIAT